MPLLRFFYKAADVPLNSFQVNLTSSTSVGCATFTQTLVPLYDQKVNGNVVGKLYTQISTNLEPLSVPQQVIHNSNFQIQLDNMQKENIFLQGLSEDVAIACDNVLLESGKVIPFQIQGGTGKFANARGQAKVIVNPVRELILDIQIPKKSKFFFEICC